MRNDQGTIRKALSGFYYVQTDDGLVTCRARGKFRYQKITPLVGDRVAITVQDDGSGSLDHILPRRNAFQRPAVANLDQLVIIASGAIPVSDPFLLDRIISLAESKECQPILCINKWDLVQAEDLLAIYQAAGIPTLSVSAATGAMCACTSWRKKTNPGKNKPKHDPSVPCIHWGRRVCCTQEGGKNHEDGGHRGPEGLGGLFEKDFPHGARRLRKPGLTLRRGT